MPKRQTNYSKTVIYKIVCKNLSITDKYVGHTTNFRQRKTNNRSICYNEASNNYNDNLYKCIRLNGGFDNWDMIEIEKYPCNDANEARAKERFWIETLEANLNCLIPNRSYTEWYEKNKEQIIANVKKWRDENKEKCKIQSKKRYEKNKEQIILYSKNYRETHKKKISITNSRSK